MIFQCPHCRALVATNHATTAGGRVGLACTDCGETAWLPVADVEEAAEGAASRPPAPARPERASSTSSGGAEAGGGEDRPPPDDAPAPAPAAAPAPGPADGHELAAVRDALRALPLSELEHGVRDELIQLLDRWHDEDAHRALINKALLQDQLAVVGQGYRAVLDVRKDDAMAHQGRERVLAAAMTKLSDFPADPTMSQAKGVVTALVAVVCVALFVGALYLVAQNFGAAAELAP